MQRLNHFIQNRSNRTIKMSVNAVKTTRLRRASLGIVRSITPFRRNGIGPGVEGSCWGKKIENHLSTRCAGSCFDGQCRAGRARGGHQSQPGEVGDGGPLKLGAGRVWLGLRQEGWCGLVARCTCDGQQVQKGKSKTLTKTETGTEIGTATETETGTEAEDGTETCFQLFILLPSALHATPRCTRSRAVGKTWRSSRRPTGFWSI